MPLPLTVNVHSGEPAFSLLSRLAARNFCTTQDFCSDMGLRWDGILDGAPTDVAFLAGLAGVDASLLQAASPTHLDAQRTSMCDLMLQRAQFSGHEVRGCPSCLAEDRNAAPLLDGAAMAIRSAWLHEFSFVCTRHAKWLEPLWTAKDRRARFDTGARFSELDLTKMPQVVENAAPTAFDLWITKRLSGDRDATWLDNFDFQAATDLCDLLGRRFVREDFPQLANMTRVDRWHALSKAFDILAQGEEAFRQVLDEMYDAGGAANDGPAKRFGVLYTNLSRHLTGEEYEPFKEILREHVFQGWPIAAGKPVLGKALPERRLHSLVTASRETGIPRERLRAMLISQDIVPARESGTIPAWELFDAASAQDLLTQMGRSITLAETLTKLNITRSQIETLRTGGYLQPDFQGEGYAPLWDPMKNDFFIASLTSGSIDVPAGDASWEPIGSAASRLRIRPGDIIASKLRGELQFGRRNGSTGYAALVVRIADVKAMRSRSQDYLNIETFAKQIGIRWPQARRLILLGLTPSTILRNPASGAPQSYISPSDLEAFHSRYVTLKTLADERREPWQSVRVWLKDTGTPRIEAEGRDFGSLYERSMLKSG